jgi:hypothetical protein
MEGRGHTKETAGLLNVNSTHLNTLFDGRSWSCQKTVGLLNVNSIHLNTLFDGRSWSYKRNRWVVKCKLYAFKHPLRWNVMVIPKKPWGC